MERKLCKKCDVELPENYNDKLCEACREKRMRFIKKALIGVGLVGATAAAVWVGMKGSDDDNNNDDIDRADEMIDDIGVEKQQPLLSAKRLLWLYDNWGEEEAEEVFDKVQSGQMSAEEVDTCINRPDIDPKDWADFEDGWRPPGW